MSSCGIVCQSPSSAPCRLLRSSLKSHFIHGDRLRDNALAFNLSGWRIAGIPTHAYGNSTHRNQEKPAFSWQTKNAVRLGRDIRMTSPGIHQLNRNRRVGGFSLVTSGTGPIYARHFSLLRRDQIDTTPGVTFMGSQSPVLNMPDS